jgi:RNA polymerase sigma factor (sigma-70 family)
MTRPDNRFDDIVLPHMDAAYNFARWLVRNDAAAQDIVQEACLRAYKGLHRFGGGSARAWLLTIVRHESYDWLARNRARMTVSLDADDGLSPADEAAVAHHDTPEAALSRLQDKQALNAALNELPEGFREVLILKELEEMSYKEIAEVTGVAIGTVMSRLSRGRAMLKQKLVGKEHASKR